MSVNIYGIALIGLSIAAGLASYIVAVCVALIVRRYSGLKTALQGSAAPPLQAGSGDPVRAKVDVPSPERQGLATKEPEESGHKGLGRTAVLRSKYVLLAFPLGFALGLYLILDLALSVSIYVQFTAIYVLLWALVLPLFLTDAPARHKLWIVGLLAVALVSVRAIHWNSRKPFLKDLYRVKEGMSAAQVEQIMGGYMTGGGVPLGSPGPRLDGRLDEQKDMMAGTISYRHTNEGWGDSDWGIVTLKDGRVVEVQFLPD